jgi:hypothetical protein
MQGIASLPCIVVRDLAGNVVQDMSFCNTVGECCTQPGWDAAQVTEEFAVERRESAARERKLRSTVMGEDRVSMLEERYQDQPMVNPGQQW